MKISAGLFSKALNVLTVFPTEGLDPPKRGVLGMVLTASDGEVSILENLPLLSAPLQLRMVVPVKAPFRV